MESMIPANANIVKVADPEGQPITPPDADPVARIGTASERMARLRSSRAEGSPTGPTRPPTDDELEFRLAVEEYRARRAGLDIPVPAQPDPGRGEVCKRCGGLGHIPEGSKPYPHLYDQAGKPIGYGNDPAASDITPE